MKYQEFLVQLRQKKIAPVYFFTGEENFLKREAVAALLKLLIAPEQKDFNYALLYGKDTTANQVLDQAQALPFMGEKRLVVLQEIEKLSDKDKLRDYLADPNPSTCLVLVAGNLDQRARKNEFFQSLTGFEVICFPPFANELRQWVAGKFQQEGKKISAGACELLIEKVGTSLSSLDSEITKILSSVNKQTVIKEEDIENILFRLYEDNAAQLEKHIAGRQLTKALVAVRDLLLEGEKDMVVIGAIAKSWRQLIVAKELQAQGVTPQEIAKKFRIKKFDEQRLLAASLANYGLAELLRKHKKIADADLAIKSGKKDPLLALETLVIGLCRQGS